MSAAAGILLAGILLAGVFLDQGGRVPNRTTVALVIAFVIGNIVAGVIRFGQIGIGTVGTRKMRTIALGLAGATTGRGRILDQTVDVRLLRIQIGPGERNIGPIKIGRIDRFFVRRFDHGQWFAL